MNITVMPDSHTAIINEVAPVLVFGLGFIIALGGIYLASNAICGWGRVNMAVADFWKGQVKIQCR